MARPDDELPEIEVVGGAREACTEVEVESVPSRSRTPWMIAVAVAVAVLAAVGLSSQGDRTEPEEKAEPTTTSSTTEAPSTTSTSRRASTTTTPPGEYLTGSPAPVLGEPVNASLLLVGQGIVSRQVNLDTGWVTEVPELRRRDGWWEFVPVEDGIVLQTGSGPKYLTLPPIAPGALPERTQVDLGIEGLDQFASYAGIVPSGRPDRLWRLTEPPTPDEPGRFTATLIDLTGSPLATVEAFAPWYRVGSSLGLLFDAGGHTYLASEEGVIPVGSGRIYAANDTFAAQVVCDAAFTCRQQIVDLVTGEIIADSEVPSSAIAEEALTMTQAPDGSIATQTNIVGPGSISPPSSYLYVLRPDGQSLRIQTHLWSPPVWLPGDLGLLALDSRGVSHYVEEGGQLVEREIPGLLRENAASIVLIPHSVRPEDL